MKKLFLLMAAAIMTLAAQASSRQVYTESETTFPKKHLIEEFTGQDCQYCPKGMDSLHAFIGNEEKWIVVCHHTYYEDNFKIDESKTIASELNVTAAPSACFNRKETTEGLLVDYVSFRKLDKAQFGDRTYASIVLNNSYDAATRTLAVHVEGQVMQNVQNLKLTVLVKESGMIAYQRDVDKTLEQYIHNDAVRTFLTDVKGNMVNVSDNRYAADYTVELDAKWVASNCTVVAFLAEDFMPVVQAEQKPVIVPKQVYTEYKDGVITYYCDNKKDSREGTTETYDPVNEPNKARFAEYAKNVTKAVIDQSMKDTMLTSLSRMFFGGYSYTLEKLTKIEGMENLNTEKAKDMSYMFCDCGALESIDLTSFSTANVTTMERMFYGCRTLTTLDVRRFNINKVTNMADMFAYCYELTTIYCNDDWSQSNALTNGYEMFEEDIKLVGGNGTKWTVWSKDEEGARPDKDGQMGYFTIKQIEAYTVFDGDHTLTYYYDEERATHTGTGVITELYEPEKGHKQNRFEGYADKVTKAVIEESFKDVKLTSLANMFNGYKYSLSALETIEEFSNIDFSEVTDMYSMFAGCSSLQSIDLSSFNTDKVTDMEYMFYNCRSLKYIDLTMFNTVNVTDMSSMFEGCSSLPSLDLRYFDTSNVTYMLSMFDRCSSLLNLAIGSFDTKNVVNMNAMFCECSSLQQLDLSTFNTENVTDMVFMFAHCSSLTDLNIPFNTGNVENMRGMFGFCRKLTHLDLRSFDVSKVNNTSSMFEGCVNLIYIYCNDDWNVRKNIEDSQRMFLDCTQLIGGSGTAYDKGKIDKEYARPDGGYLYPRGYFTEVEEPTEVYTEFDESTGTLTYYYDNKRKKRPGNTKPYEPEKGHDQNRFEGYADNVKKVVIHDSFKSVKMTSLANMFNGKDNTLTSLTKIEGLGNIDLSKVVDMYAMFAGCSSLKYIDLSSFNTENLMNMERMFEKCSALETIKFGETFAANVTNMSRMFDGCIALKSLDFSSFNTEYVTDMEGMLFGCTALETVMFGEAFNTANVTDMYCIFANCTALTSIDLSSFDTKKVTNMQGMFYGCSALTTIYCDDDWSTSTADSEYMFDGCSKLKGGNGTEWNETNPTDNSYARLDKDGEPGYFTSTKIQEPQKDELNALIQELKALYDFAKQYVGESELANLKKSIEGFEAVYNDGAEAEVSKAISDAQTALKNVKATVMPTSKTAAKATLDGMLQNGDNDNCKDIINDAKGKIDALAWDDTKTAEENTAILEPAIKKIIDDAEKALAAERDAMTIAAAKAKLNAAIQDLKAIYDFAKQYVGESELANLKRSIEGFEAVYNDKAATMEDINKAASEAQAALKNVKIVMMATGKTILKATLNGMLLPTDSEEAKDIIKDAKDKIDALAWDDSKTVEENIAALDKAVKAILAKAEKDIEATRNTGIDEVESQKTKAESLKVIRNGQLLIIRDGKTYNAVGAEVR